MKKLYNIFLLLTFFILIFTISVSAQFVRVISDFANIRTMPDSESRIVGEALENDIFKYISDNGDWVEIVMFSDDSRYVHRSLVKVLIYSISAPFSNDVCPKLMERLEEAKEMSLSESDVVSQNILFDRYVLDIFHEFELQPVIYLIALNRCIEGPESKIGQGSTVEKEKVTNEYAEKKVEGEANILKYTVREKQDTSYLNTPRMVYRIILDIDKLPSDKEMEKTAIDIWEKGNKNCKEFTVFIYLPEMDTKSLAYGVGEFNQNGLKGFKKNEYALIETKWEIAETKKIINSSQFLEAKLYKVELDIVNEGERKVNINIDTNFPDGTNLHIWVKRIYYEGGDLDTKYAGDIFAADLSVKKGKIESIVDVNDSGWYNEYYKKAEEYKGIIDFPGITHTSPEIEISVLFSPKRWQQKDILKILGENGEYIDGPDVDKSGNFNILRVSKSLEIPFKK